MKLVYVAYGNVSVFDSQVVALLNYYIEKNIIDELILILGIDYKASANDKITKKLNKKIKIYSYKHYPQYLFIEKLTIRSIEKVLREIDKIEDYVIHVRNDMLAYYVYKAFKKFNSNNIRMIADVRGAGLEQLIEYSNKNKLIVWLKKEQRKKVNKVLRKINHLSVVSKSLENYVYDKVGKNIDVRVNSCLSNQNFKFDVSERKKLRDELSIQNNESLLVLSTGGDNAWQNTKHTIEALTAKNFKVLNLSKTEIQNKNVITKFVPYKEMFKYLCAADAAIIWRNNSITNKVASPVKFSEYVCCGLPVLTNNSIDLITDYIKINNCGKIIDSLASIKTPLLNELQSLDRNAISIKGQNDFGIQTIAHQYSEFYKSI